MNKQRKAIIEANKISTVEEFMLGGRSQKVLIEGKSDDLSVVITLHGGPGTPVPFCVGARGLFPEFTDKCILVSWDQYGCGINNAKLPDDISVNDFAEMTLDLIKHIRNRFPLYCDSSRHSAFVIMWYQTVYHTCQGSFSTA